MTISFTSAAKILISKTLRKQALEILAFEFVFDFDFFSMLNLLVQMVSKCPTRIALWQPNMCFAWSNSKYIHQLLRNRERLEGKLVSTLLSQNMQDISWSARFLQKGRGLDSLQPNILLKIVL